MAIYFHTEDIDFNYKEKRKSKKWIKIVISNQDFKVGNLNIIFSSDTYLLKINQDYLNHNHYTDVITFDYLDEQNYPDTTNNSDHRTIGDIYICCDLAETAARQHKNDFSTEIILYIVHGILHLCGYNDLEKADVQNMRSKEKEILSLLNDEFELTKLFEITTT